MNSWFSRFKILSVVSFALAIAVLGNVGAASAQTYYQPDANVTPQPAQVVDPNDVQPAPPVPPSGYIPAVPQVGLPECPVPYYDLRNVLRGMYGVDALQRPVNPYGFPVDIYGNCLTPVPVTNVYNYAPRADYVNFLYLHWGYRYAYVPGFIRLVPFGGPGVFVYRSYGAIPYGHTVIGVRGWAAPAPGIIMNNRTTINTVIAPNVSRPGFNQGGRVTTTGPSQQVRPGAQGVSPGVTTGGPSQQVRPGAQTGAPPAAVAPPRAAQPPVAVNPGAAVAPPRAAPGGGPGVFNRQNTGAPPAAAVAPRAPSGSFAPPRATGGPSMFNRGGGGGRRGR